MSIFRLKNSFRDNFKNTYSSNGTYRLDLYLRVWAIFRLESSTRIIISFEVMPILRVFQKSKNFEPRHDLNTKMRTRPLPPKTNCLGDELGDLCSQEVFHFDKV